MLSLAERLRREEDCSPLRDAVLSLRLDSRPELMVGISMLGCGWPLVLPGIPWLDWLDWLLDGVLLAVCDWLWLLLDELLEELDWDWDEELEEDCDWDCDGCAGGCCCVCWLLQPATTAPSTITEARVRHLALLRISSSTAFRSDILSLLKRLGALSDMSDFTTQAGQYPACVRWLDELAFQPQLPIVWIWTALIMRGFAAVAGRARESRSFH